MIIAVTNGTYWRFRYSLCRISLFVTRTGLRAYRRDQRAMPPNVLRDFLFCKESNFMTNSATPRVVQIQKSLQLKADSAGGSAPDSP